jgi:uncharacterized protein
MAAIVIDTDKVSPEFDYPRPDRRVTANPKRTTWNVYENSSGEVFAGVWSCEVGAWQIEMGPTEDEFFFVVSGRCKLVDTAGIAVSVGAGESLVIPAGFKGVFEVLEPIKKHYMIVNRKA